MCAMSFHTTGWLGAFLGGLSLFLQQSFISLPTPRLKFSFKEIRQIYQWVIKYQHWYGILNFLVHYCIHWDEPLSWHNCFWLFAILKIRIYPWLRHLSHHLKQQEKNKKIIHYNLTQVPIRHLWQED